MRNIQQISHEINELEQIKLAYAHFLASHEAQISVENATLVKNNKAIVSLSLHRLYIELMQAKAACRQAARPQVKTMSYACSAVEANAIVHFNRDRRFTITE